MNSHAFTARSALAMPEPTENTIRLGNDVA